VAAQYVVTHPQPSHNINSLSFFALKKGILILCIAQSKASFISKLSIVLEESDESSFWLEFIIDEQLMKTNLVAPLLNEARELTVIFYACRKTARKKHIK